MIYLTVVIPVRNEERFLGETLRALAEQEYPKDRFEILVVDGRSTDRTRDVVRELEVAHPEINLRLLDNPGKLSSCARNIGAREAAGQLVAVIDGHVHIPGRELFANMERLKEEHAALALSRPAPLDVPGLAEDSWSHWIAAARKTWLGHSRSSQIYGATEGFVDPVSAGFAYDRSVFERVGWFDESFDACEDVEFHHRLKKAGIQAYSSAGFLIYSYPRESLRSLFRQQVRYGEGRARFVRKHRDGFTWETAIPAALLLFWVVGPLLLLPVLPAVLRAMWFGLACAYGGILLGTGLENRTVQGRFGPGAKVALAAGTTHIGLGWGFLGGFLRFRGPPDGETEAFSERRA